MQEGVAASTRRSYCTGIRRYLAFCAAGRRTPFPASENQLMDFAAFVAQSAGYCTIKVYLAGIRLEHTQRGLQNPFSSCPRLQLVLRGIRRKLARTPCPRLSITVDILRKVKRSLRHASDMSPYDVALTWIACTLAFFGFLRCAEFTAVGLRRFTDTNIRREDAKPSDDNFLVFLRGSKTDPFRQGHTIVISPSGRSVCAVRALRRFLSLRQGRQEEPLFRLVDGTYLTRTTFTSRLRSHLQAAGIDETLYAGHSFRIGAANTAAAAGLPSWLIQTLGRWSSDCYRLYIHTAFNTLCKVAAQLASTSAHGVPVWRPPS